MTRTYELRTSIVVQQTAVEPRIYEYKLHVSLILQTQGVTPIPVGTNLARTVLVE